jgi:N6-adenosine-specific RNA methylase IME4
MIGFHPLAQIFPLMEGEEFEGLVADIKAHGLFEPIVTYEGQILDGRNRYRACLAAGIDCESVPYTDDNDPLGYVVSRNLKRRHLSESQRAMVAARLATLKRGDNQYSFEHPSIEGSSNLLNVGHASVERAKAVQRAGVPELIAAVDQGKVSVSGAADIATEPPEQQREIVARGEREILEAAKRIRGERAESRRNERIARIAEISNANAPLPQDRKYPVILADPPWAYEVYDEESGSARAAANHYPTMQLADICRLPVAELATPDAVLFLWATVPCLEQAFEVIKAWGFKYVSNYVWTKDKIGNGFWNRNQHEHLLTATRGNFPAPRPSDRLSSVISAPGREHSRKPDEAYARIERIYPELAKVELFARGHARRGWSAWGNQAEPDPGDLSISPFLRREASTAGSKGKPGRKSGKRKSGKRKSGRPFRKTLTLVANDSARNRRSHHSRQ